MIINNLVDILEEAEDIGDLADYQKWEDDYANKL